VSCPDRVPVDETNDAVEPHGRWGSTLPEGVEIEIYRRSAETVVGRTIMSVEAPDPWFLKHGATAATLTDAATHQQVDEVRRIGKLLILDLANGVRLGLRFGMTGRLIVDGTASIDSLEYSSSRNEPAWDRFALRFDNGGDLRIRDPRRLGGVELDPDEDALGADVFTITPTQLRRRVTIGDVALKARLLDQSRIAGVGNLIADETLWRAGLDPGRRAGSLDDDEVNRLARTLRSVVSVFLRDGGSHTGLLQPVRIRGGSCPKDGRELQRRQIGGRTTFSCPQHQS
jgi:formamidopyrimidine-DNA glycosylase